MEVELLVGKILESEDAPHALYDVIAKSLRLVLHGEIVGTEMLFPKKSSSEEVLDLTGKVDLLWRLKDGFVIQEIKSSKPPEGEEIYKHHKVEIDAYAFLVEKEGYLPVIRSVVIYADLNPRNVLPSPERIPDLVQKVNQLLLQEALPEVADNCQYCVHIELCSLLPKRGDLTTKEVLKKIGRPSGKKEDAIIAQFESKSKPGSFYSVVKTKEGKIFCDCPGWKYHRKCWHIERVFSSEMVKV